MKILDRGMRPSRSLQEPTIFSDKFCSLEAQKFLANFWYNKYYRWLTEIFPSMQKGETVGNIVIDGKGIERRSTRIIIENKGVDQDQLEYKGLIRQRRQKLSREA